MLRKLHRQTVEVTEGKLERKRSKREKIAHFFRSRRLSSQYHHGVHSTLPTTAAKTPHISHPTPLEVTKSADISVHKQPSPEEGETSTVAAADLAPPPSEEGEEQKDVLLTKDEIQALFSGAPQFSIQVQDGRSTAVATCSWTTESTTNDASDSIRPSQSAFGAATLHAYSPKSQQLPKEQHIYPSADVVEVPSMLSAQGIEPGSIGLSHFLELPTSDSLITNQEETQSSKEFLQATKNKELLQTTPERLGIRTVDMSMTYGRLLELQDIYEAFKDSPGPMSILNNQSAGDLYANLFSKFLTPPGFDDSADDPTGLEIQISTLLRVLNLRGVWYDFSLVEWRIRLGQILWSDPEPVPQHETHPLWTEREILLLQITLACELFLRLDAVTNTKGPEFERQHSSNPRNVNNLLKKKSRKLAWDLVLARRFLDNILVVKSNDDDDEATAPKSRGFLAILGGGEAPAVPKQDIILLPQHQGRQLTGLLEFAEKIQWPNTNTVMKDIATKLGMRDSVQQLEQLPSADKMLHEFPISPASISVYGTPLQTPRSANHMLDGYFGHIGKPALKRDNSQSLRIPLSPMLSPLADRPKSALTNVGGWLSRSFLTGLVLPGEAISHFLISTLLENDHAAIACLGDSANLYGGFTYADRSWWSKNSIVGRILACIEGSTECMGWISIPKPPQGLTDGWHSIYNESVPFTERLSGTVLTQDSAVVPSGASIRSEDFVLPSDLEGSPTNPVFFSHWELMPLNRDLIDDENLGPPTESDVHAPTTTFTSQFKTSPHILTMAYDVQFVSSWPCTPPGSIPAPSLPLILRRSLTGTVSRTSSKRSVSTKLSRRNSHGFEPLLSHPPDSTDIAPKRMYVADVNDDTDGILTTKKPMKAHPLHASYKYKIVSASDVVQADFKVPFDMQSRRVTTPSHPTNGEETRKDMDVNERNTVLVLDARSSVDAQLLSRAWCAESGFHALIGSVGRTCLACCIREAKGLGLHVVIRV